MRRITWTSRAMDCLVLSEADRGAELLSSQAAMAPCRGGAPGCLLKWPVVFARLWSKQRAAMRFGPKIRSACRLALHSPDLRHNPRGSYSFQGGRRKCSCSAERLGPCAGCLHGDMQHDRTGDHRSGVIAWLPSAMSSAGDEHAHWQMMPTTSAVAGLPPLQGSIAAFRLAITVAASFSA